MSEIHDMLNRIVELSTKSANGTIQDEVDREAIQAEVDVLVDEIDRIAQATNFNGIDLLNGNLSDGGLVIKTNTFTETITTENTPQVDTDDTIVFTSKLNIDTSLSTTVGSFTVYGGVQGVDFDYNATTCELTILSSTDMRIEGNNSTTTESIVVDDSVGSANLAINNVQITNDSGSAFYTGDNDVYIELEGDNELSSTYGYYNSFSDFESSSGLNVGESASLIIDGAGSLTANGGVAAAGIGCCAWGTSGDITINGGTINANGGYQGAGIGTGWGGRIDNITINGGNITAIGPNSTGIGAGDYGIAGDITINGGVIEAIGDLVCAGIGSGYYGVCGDITYIEEMVSATGYVGVGAGEFGTVGTITKIPLPTTDDDTDTDTNGETTYTTTTVTRTEVYNGDGLILHVADQNNPYNKIEVFIDSMRTLELGIDPLDVSSQESAGACINIIKDAINYVSKNRGDLGALQNRLERTINNNNNTSENMTSAKSAIKDTDMAKEMMEYTKMSVLTEASQSMLAQSNQAPQQILSLLG